MKSIYFKAFSISFIVIQLLFLSGCVKFTKDMADINTDVQYGIVSDFMSTWKDGTLYTIGYGIPTVYPKAVLVSFSELGIKETDTIQNASESTVKGIDTKNRAVSVISKYKKNGITNIAIKVGEKGDKQESINIAVQMYHFIHEKYPALNESGGNSDNQ
ncbi:MAG: hypothetical protein GY756_04285 [bacterium]|nr:hypothetical protein [bacterium]